MQDLTSFYQNQINKHQAVLAKVKRQLYASSMVRLAIFCLTAIGIYFLFGNTKWVLTIVLLTIVAFLFLVSRHADLQRKRDKLKALIKINKTEVKVLDRDFHHLPEGNEFKDPLHHFSQDIDLFGRGSFYQYANRTALQQGSETLAAIFNENSLDEIFKKQEAIKELSQLPEWRQDFSATASLTKAETSTTTIVKWLDNYVPFVPQLMKLLPLLFSAVSFAVFVFYYLDFVPLSLLIIWLLSGLGITSAYFKKIQKLGGFASKMQSTFQQYNQLLLQIEDTDFTSELLQERKDQILSNHEKTSSVIKKFSNLLNSLDKNYNIFYLIFANGFFLRTLTHCFNIEKWIEKHGSSVERWFETIAFFDAYNSLGNFAFNHPDYTFPKLSQEKTVLKSKGAGHKRLSNRQRTVLYHHGCQYGR